MLTAEAVALDQDLKMEALEVDDGTEYGSSSDEVHDVWETVVPESLLQEAYLSFNKKRRWKSATSTPFEPCPELTVVGEEPGSQMLIAMNEEMPEPGP